ncbi:MAG: elongation factor P [Bacteroidetes bacterium]|nr:MAG: elongation factor P [Bacteroidota bacterium]RLD85353.1 MAG: elongation factor P [Bacteroidota bacterium]
MASTTDFKNGLCIEYNNNLYTIVQFQHVKPGKGPAFVRTKLKNLKTGKVIDNTFNSGVKINVARIERRQYQFLYKDDIGYNLMNLENFEQIPLQEDLFNSPHLMKDGQEIDVVFHADTETPLYTELPPFVILEITYTEPGLKGDTSSSSSNKWATLETDAKIQVPLFVNTGDKIKIDTRDNSYSERIKS